MNVLVLNSGSSSLKFQVINPRSEKVSLKGHVDGIGLKTCIVKVNGEEMKAKVQDHVMAVELALDAVNEGGHKFEAIGHRVVHGGEMYKGAAKIDATVIRNIKKLIDLAPLHNPPNLEGILACKKLMPKIKQYAIFDTAFHQTIEEGQFRYAIKDEYYKKFGIRKYGFHGSSHKYITFKLGKIVGKKNVSLISCHLGNGSSICAISKGKSVDTSMGLTPLQGLIMGTRSGDIDPEIVSILCRKLKKKPEEVIHILNKESGLKAITGSSDVRDIYAMSKKANSKGYKSKLAFSMLADRIAFYIMGYMSKLSEVHGIAFTAGVGEGAFYLRKSVCDKLKLMGVEIDAKINGKNKGLITEPTKISAAKSKIDVYVIPTNEELMIAKETVEASRKP